ncbi:MAG: LPS export ABC transporter periplasmic protein LptC [Candidatus Electrothrix sp. AR3]|nr:LPS export ABC transporter periplasmic protein LptC [Candidatus Electrothrix sp. AR3]
MLEGIRNLLWMIPLGLIISAPLWQEHAAAFLKPRGGYDAAAERAYSEDSQDFIMDDVILTFSTRGAHTWTIRAKQAKTGKSDREIEMLKVDAVYSKKGDSPMTITSKRGRYQMDDKHLTLIEDVLIVKPAQQEELYTDLLHYYDKTAMLISPQDVKINGPKFNLKAGKMDYNLSTKAYDFKERVDVVL